MSRPAAIILAAGASQRMGSPKPLLKMPGPGDVESFLDHLIAALGACCAPVVVVLGHDAEKIRSGIRRASQAVFVTNNNYAQGQLSSLQRGLAALSGTDAGVVFTPVDHALVEPRTIAALVSAFVKARGDSLWGGTSVRQPGFEPAGAAPGQSPVAGSKARPHSQVVIPTYQGRHGHPVCCAHDVVADLMALPPGAQARDAIHSRRAETLYLEVDDPGVVLDVDDRETYARALEAGPR